MHNNYRAANLLAAVKLRVSPRYAAVSALKSAVRVVLCEPRQKNARVSKIAPSDGKKSLAIIRLQFNAKIQKKYNNFIIKIICKLQEKKQGNFAHARIYAALRCGFSTYFVYARNAFFLERYVPSTGIEQRFPRGASYAVPAAYPSFPCNFITWYVTRRALYMPKTRDDKFLTVQKRLHTTNDMCRWLQLSEIKTDRN